MVHSDSAHTNSDNSALLTSCSSGYYTKTTPYRECCVVLSCSAFSPRNLSITLDICLFLNNVDDVLG